MYGSCDLYRREKLLTRLVFAEIGIVATRASDAGLLCSLSP